MRKIALLVMLLLVVCFGFLFAQDNGDVAVNENQVTQENANEESVPAEVEEDSEDWIAKLGPTNLIRVFAESGVFAWVILGIFLISVFYALIRFYQLMVKEKIDSNKFHLKIKGLVKSGSLKEAIAAAELVQRTTMGQIYRIGLLAYKDAKNSGKTGDSLKEEVQNAFNEAAYQTIPEIDRGLHWFDLLAQSSTYLGLLGTIMGLIQAFSGISETEVLMGGIKQAMGTTALGLIGAIAIQFIKGFLSTRAEKIINELDANSVKIMNVINNQVQD
jgi:biopolymer transport protein ExbB/TolQ